jgi:hypothetical protein
MGFWVKNYFKIPILLAFSAALPCIAATKDPVPKAPPKNSSILKACSQRLGSEDINQRKLESKIITSMNQCSPPKKGSTVLALEKETEHKTVQKLLNDINQDALKRSIQANAAYSMKFQNATPASIEKKICSSEHTQLACKDPAQLKQIQNAIQTLPAIKKPNADALKNLNVKIKRLQQVCAAAIKQVDSVSRDSSNKKQDLLSTKITFEPSTTATSLPKQSDRKMKQFKWEFTEQAKVNRALEDVINSELGFLYITPALQKSSGAPIALGSDAFCRTGSLKLATESMIQQAHKEFNELSLKEINNQFSRKASKTPNAYADYTKNVDSLKQQILYCPSSIASALQKNQDPKYAELVCRQIEEIYSDDQWSQNAQQALSAAGMVAAAGLAASGIGAPIGAGLAGLIIGTSTAVTVAQIGLSTSDYISNTTDANRSVAAASNQHLGTRESIQQSQKAEKRANAAVQDGLENIAMEAVGGGVGLLAKNAKGAKWIADSDSKKYFAFENKIKTAKSADEIALLKNQDQAFAAFKKDIGFDSMTPKMQEELLADLHSAHKTGYTTRLSDGSYKPNRDKSEALQALKAKLQSKYGVKDKNKAFAMVDQLSNSKTRILGELEPSSLSDAENIFELKDKLDASDYKKFTESDANALLKQVENKNIKIKQLITDDQDKFVETFADMIDSPNLSKGTKQKMLDWAKNNRLRGDYEEIIQRNINKMADDPGTIKPIIQNSPPKKETIFSNIEDTSGYKQVVHETKPEALTNNDAESLLEQLNTRNTQNMSNNDKADFVEKIAEFVEAPALTKANRQELLNWVKSNNRELPADYIESMQRRIDQMP